MTKAVHCILFAMLSVASKTALAGDNQACEHVLKARMEYVGYVPVDVEEFIRHFFPHSEYVKNLGRGLFVKLRVVNLDAEKLTFTGYAAKDGFEVLGPYERIQMEYKNSTWKYNLGLVGDGLPPPDGLEIMPGKTAEILGNMSINDGEAEEFRKFRIVVHFAKDKCVVSDPFVLDVKAARLEINKINGPTH